MVCSTLVFEGVIMCECVVGGLLSSKYISRAQYGFSSLRVLTVPVVLLQDTEERERMPNEDSRNVKRRRYSLVGWGVRPLVLHMRTAGLSQGTRWKILATE